MKTNINDILSANKAITTLVSSKMQANKAFKFRKILNAFNNSVDAFNATRAGLLKKYDIEEGAEIPANIKENLEAEFALLIKEEVDIDIKKLEVSDFDGLEITPMDLDALFWLINEE